MASERINFIKQTETSWVFVLKTFFVYYVFLPYQFLLLSTTLPSLLALCLPLCLSVYLFCFVGNSLYLSLFMDSLSLFLDRELGSHVWVQSCSRLQSKLSIAIVLVIFFGFFPQSHLLKKYYFFNCMCSEGLGIVVSIMNVFP